MLPVNIVNEKIYVFLWFWFIGLAVLTGLGLIYRFAICFYPEVRLHRMRSRCLSPHKHIKNVVRDMKIGDWLILNQVGKNMNPFFYRDLITAISKKLDSTVVLKD